MQQKFIMQEHQADIKFLVNADSLNGVFENSAEAFSSYISSGEKISKKLKKEVKLSAENTEKLLYLFLDHLIYLLDAENFAVSQAKVKIAGKNLNATMTGDGTKKYNLNHIKAATYAEMQIKNKGKKWACEFVLDV